MKQIKVLWEKQTGSLAMIDGLAVDLTSHAQVDRESAIDEALTAAYNNDLFATEVKSNKRNVYRVLTATGRIVGEVAIV